MEISSCPCITLSVLQVQLCVQLSGQLDWGTDAGLKTSLQKRVGLLGRIF